MGTCWHSSTTWTTFALQTPWLTVLMCFPIACVTQWCVVQPGNDFLWLSVMFSKVGTNPIFFFFFLPSAEWRVRLWWPVGAKMRNREVSLTSVHALSHAHRDLMSISATLKGSLSPPSFRMWTWITTCWLNWLQSSKSSDSLCTHWWSTASICLETCFRLVSPYPMRTLSTIPGTQKSLWGQCVTLLGVSWSRWR